jgi:hypothetical protein
MSAEKFAIDLPDGDPLSKGDLVEHREHGPMHVDDIRVGPYRKNVMLVSELGPSALKLSGDDIREQWGESIHTDPEQLYDDSMRVSREGVSVEDLDISVDITIDGSPEWAMQAVDAHILDAAVSALEAVRDGNPPTESEGVYDIDWDAVLENHDGDMTLREFEDGDSA